MKILRYFLCAVLLVLSNDAVGFLFFNHFVYCEQVSPFECGDVDIQFQAGICPIRWNDGGHISINSFAPFVASPTLSLFRHVHFSNLYHLPWILGMQTGYSWSEHARLYFEVNYAQAQAQQDVGFNTDSTPTLPAAITLNKYKLIDAYVGGRYYWDRYWCERVSFFLGGKIGLVHHCRNTFDLVIGIPQLGNQTVLLDVPVFDSRTSISGGINGGFDICCGNWSLVFTSEVVISRGPQVGDDLLVSPPISNIFSTIFFGKVGTELRFPITAGIRYTF